MKYSKLGLTVLKNILAHKKHAVEFAAECPETIFPSDLFRFGKICVDYIKVHKESPTRKTLLEQDAVKKNEQLQNYIGEVFDEIDQITAEEKEYKHDLKKLKDEYATNLLANLKESLHDNGGQDLQASLKIIQQNVEKIKSLYQNKVYEQKTLKSSLDEFTNRYMAKSKDPNFGRGIYTGYRALDFQTNGLRPAELCLIAGESGSGKSMMLMNLAIQMWMQQNTVDTPKDQFKQGYNVLYFSLEMPWEQCMNRVMSNVALAPYRNIRDGNLMGPDLDKVKSALKFVKRYPWEFEIVDIPRGVTIEKLEIIFNETKLRFNPDIVVVDYLGLMDYDGPEADDWLKLGKISEQLHEFARVYNVCVLSAVQLNRMAKAKGSTEEEKIGAHRIGRSALIIQNANIALQIEKRDQENNYPDMAVHIIKNRDGELIKIRLQKNFACCSLKNDDVTEHEFSNTDDISDKVAKLNDLSE